MRTRLSMHGFSVLLSVSAIWLLGGTLAHADETLNFQVLKDGEPIGYEKVAISDTEQGRTVNVETLTDVRVLFLKFHYDHQRTETWKNNELVSVTSTTNDDGTHYTYQADYQDGCYTVAGKSVPKRDVCDNAWPLTLWDESVTGKSNLYSVINAEPYAVTTTKVGTETLRIDNREIPAVHYVMSGDVERDIWFDQQGKMIKTSFKRKGYDIDFLRVDELRQQ
ncbi:DUF6134 family protein [Thalassospira sp. MA62]|nr:DUF6134 family protein [Thalassospira sp. MA62]